jgi:hypothetical protein
MEVSRPRNLPSRRIGCTLHCSKHAYPTINYPNNLYGWGPTCILYLIRKTPNWFFSLKYILLCIYCSKMQKTHFFFNEISSKNFKFLNGHWFNSCISISYTKKNHSKIPFITLVLKYVCIFFKLCDMDYFVTNIFHTFNFFNFCWIKKNLD